MPSIWPRAAVEVADDVAHELLGHRDLDPHHRLEHDRVRLATASLIAIEPAILNAISDESTVVVRAVDQRDLDVDHRERPA